MQIKKASDFMETPIISRSGNYAFRFAQWAADVHICPGIQKWQVVIGDMRKKVDIPAFEIASADSPPNEFVEATRRIW
jgi:hypothetical protein